LTRRTNSIEFENVSKIAVRIAFGELMGPRFEFGRINFDRGATASTGEVMMMGVNDTSAIEALTAISHNDVDFVR
jgi:hypothetical protein